MHYLRSAHNFGLFSTLCVRVHALTSFLFSTTKSWSFINLSNFPRSTAVLASLHISFGYFQTRKALSSVKIFSDRETACHLIFYYCYVWKFTYSDKENATVIWYVTIFEKEKIVRKGKHICYLIFDNFQTRKTRLSFETWQLL